MYSEILLSLSRQIDANNKNNKNNNKLRLRLLRRISLVIFFKEKKKTN